jgi:hypothetical protein
MNTLGSICFRFDTDKPSTALNKGPPVNAKGCDDCITVVGSCPNVKTGSDVADDRQLLVDGGPNVKTGNDAADD